MPQRATLTSRFQLRCVEGGLRWSLIAKFMKTRVSQSAATIPLIGYLLLWSEELQKYLILQSALMGGLWFSVTGRLLFLYFGAIFLAVAWGVYALWCPRLIQRMTDVSDYLFNEMQTEGRTELARVRVELAGLLDIDPDDTSKSLWRDGLPAITLTTEMSAKNVARALRLSDKQAPFRSEALRAWYIHNEGIRFRAQVVAAFSALIGIVFVALPSIEVFLSVILRVLLPFIANAF